MNKLKIYIYVSTSGQCTLNLVENINIIYHSCSHIYYLDVQVDA